MKSTVVAIYTRESTLWRNANAFYQSQDWVKMKCIVYDYTEEIESTKPGADVQYRFVDINGNDITDQEVERRWGKPFAVEFENKRKNNWKTYTFKTKEEANNFVKEVLKDKALGSFKRVR